ncbi:TPA: hypothetical protein TZW69_000237 [Streptococcus suis]|uniref:Uncharacterized protein n=1 Tax=Streptococcus suis TaxID=1307 RepID=A0A7T1LA41_STRSU|nr:hypothetical protein [Streptococcus suis]MCQ8785950.1 hypothetical protein [Streptococcus suis]NRG74905.1 hypothetical protein [Streptococcus suis]QPO26529.1 hypothetical protein I5V48_11440 [Streptococcus suis]WQE85406.1 hypothetical protein U0N78_10530 [Streptococcus suis]HEL1650210.1 hypothetical protein [Streptococcus suis]
MKKLPTYIGVIIFVVTLLINWLLPSLAKVLNTFFIWTIIACLCYTIYYWISYWLYVRKQR